MKSKRRFVFALTQPDDAEHAKHAGSRRLTNMSAGLSYHPPDMFLAQNNGPPALQ
jgi:hypothetical protein